MTHNRFTAALCAGVAAGLLAGIAPAALAETPPTITRAEKLSGSVLVKDVDLASRKVTLTSSSGEDVTFDVPEEYHNLDRLKAGDRITGTYVRETEIKVSKRNARTPEDAATLVAARAEKGEQPAALVANKIVVTGALVGIDMATHTLQLVSPQGGEVVTVPVTRPDGQEAMSKLKVGDRITATITEGLVLAAVSP